MIKPLSAAIACILLAPATSFEVVAQETPASDPAAAEQASGTSGKTATDLDRVIVTGTRSPKAVDKIPGAINIVSTEEVQHTQLLTEDATAVLARTVPGYAESTQALSNTGETLRGRIPLRLFDGVPQGSPLREGGRSATFTDLGVIGRIEVINGPSASEGIGASGGIINYISRTPTKEGNETTLTTRFGSQGYSDSDNYKVGLTFARKQDAYDVFVAGSYVDRGITYDGDGRRIGINTSGSVSDSTAKNLFFKVGYNFGDGQTQRLQATYSKFKIDGKGNYIQVIGCRAVPTDNPPCGARRTNTSERGEIFGSKSAFNDFEQEAVQYTHSDFFGGSLVLDVYSAEQAMRYLPENGDDRQLVKVGPGFDEGTRIFDQSEIRAKKKGLRSAWTRGGLFGVDGLEMRIGFDYVDDQADQRLALTDRLWVPPLKYKSKAPFVQLTWDVGPITVSGGFRREDDELTVDDYTTTAFRNSVAVQGGGVQYKENLRNLGAIWRITDQWSTFVSYGEGFGLPNIGIPLRNISTPGQSVDRIDGLAPIIFDNVETGFNWRGSSASLSGSVYRSKSDFGASLAVDPATNDYILSRAPVTIEGLELSGDYRFSDALKVTALYSRIRGKTAFWSADTRGRYGAGGLERPLGVLDINPDKFSASVTWNFLANADLTLGSTTLFSRDISGSDTRAFDNANFTYSEKTTGYTLLDLGVNYDTGRYGKVSLGIDNLLDRQYLLSGSQVDTFLNYWAGRGRTITFTHTLTF